MKKVIGISIVVFLLTSILAVKAEEIKIGQSCALTGPEYLASRMWYLPLQASSSAAPRGRFLLRRK